MAKGSSEVSRFDAKSTNRDDEVATTSVILGRAPKQIPDIPHLTRHGGATVISVVNQKGGVGKTTTTINLGAALAELGRRVLVVDLDPQHSLSVGLGVYPAQIESSIYNLLMDESTNVENFLLKTSVPGMDLIPGHRDLAAAEMGLINVIAREKRLKQRLEPILDFYDVILIDCLPSLGILTINALTASTGVIVPLECEYFALRGVGLIDETIKSIQKNTNPDLKLIGILATMFDRKTMHSRDVLERLDEVFPNHVFDTLIGRTVRFSESTAKGEPITQYANNSAGASAYRRLARELIFIGGTK